MRVVLDTNVVSALMHRVPVAMERLRACDPPDVLLCTPVAAEIHYGLSRLAPGSRRHILLSAEYARLRQILDWADWTEAAAVEFGRQKALLEERGSRVDDMDVAIASIALTLGACVASGNLRHFSRIEGLAVEDWTG
jgi:tRNA(fMet)-specific endonuclease VapC